ncbi:MAG: hypothetical protein QMD92_00145 [bacterium]|nr:hypothetical protein [bacterium]
MIKVGYKVVESSLRSPIMLGRRGAVEYKVNESVHPNKGCGPLTVFKEKQAAEHFRNGLILPLRIFKCFYIPSKAKEVWYIVDAQIVSTTSLEELISINFNILAPGSVDLAKEVILAEEI